MEKTFSADPGLANYVDWILQPEDRDLEMARLNSEVAQLPAIQVAKFDARHLEILSRMMAPKKAIEVGGLGGYSAIALARGLAPGGKLYSLEIQKTHIDVAKETLKKCGLLDRVEFRLGAALDSLTILEKEGPFDLVFIDADKVNYENYFEWAKKNLRTGGVVIADNVFAWGGIHRDPISGPDEDSVRALRLFNSKVAKDPCFRTTMLPTGEGLTVAVKTREP
ncbi:MAG: O-methyltransferase [Pseudobdellovibrionaceae bacterium]